MEEERPPEEGTAVEAEGQEPVSAPVAAVALSRTYSDLTAPRLTVNELKAAAEILQSELIKIHAQEVHDEALQNIFSRLERSEARAADAEERLLKMEQFAAEAKRKNLQSAALIAMAGGGGRGAKKEDGPPQQEVMDAISHLGGELATLHQAVISQGRLIGELNQDVARLTDIVCHPPASEGGEGGDGDRTFLTTSNAVGHPAIPEGYAGAVVSGSTNAGGNGGDGGAGGQLPPQPQPQPQPQPPHLRAINRSSRLAELEQGLVKVRAEVRDALIEAGLLDAPGYPAGGRPPTLLDQRLQAVDQKLQAELAAVEAALREQHGALRQEQTDGEARVADALRQSMADELAKRAGELVAGGTSPEALAARIGTLEAGRATKQDLEALGEAVRETRAQALVARSTHSSEEVPERLAYLQAAQQSTQGHVLSLQTHLRALLRKAEIEKAASPPSVDIAMVDGLRAELQGALSELQSQLHSLHAGKADAERVEAALDTKAERAVVANKVDRAFCEGLLARFAVEVGRQLGDMEQNQTSIRESLEDALVRMMSTSADAAVHPHHHHHTHHLGGSPSAADAGTPHAIRGYDEGNAYSLSGGGGGAMAEEPASAPFAVNPLLSRADAPSSAHTRRKGARDRSAAALADAGHAPPPGKGILQISHFLTGAGHAPTPNSQQYAFQPRRPSGLMTPGEQQLVRQRPRSSSGRLGHSASAAAGLLSGSAAAGGVTSAARLPSPGMRA